MDSGLVMYFGDRPSIPVYEIRHAIQCHEEVWWAKTETEWAQCRKTMAVNDAEFPLLMSMLISPDIPSPPSNLSVLGGFDLLHGRSHLGHPNVGLHIHIWIQQQYEASIGEDQRVRQIVFRKRNEEVQMALRKWREGWEATLTSFPSSRTPLYQRSSLAFWFLAKYFNEVKDSRHSQSGFCGAERHILPVGRLLRAIFMMIDSGKLNDNSPASAIHPSEVEETNLRNASLDTMNINFIMYEKREIPG
jgi:hypothetical protein